MKYMLRTRLDDESAWSEAEEYPTRGQRDKAARLARVIGGIRTHSYEVAAVRVQRPRKRRAA